MKNIYTIHNGYINETCNLNIKHFTGATVSLWLLWWRVWRENVVESSLEDSCQEQVTYVLDLWWGIHREVWPSQALCCSWCHQALSLCWMWKSLCLSIRSSQTCHYTYRLILFITNKNVIRNQSTVRGGKRAHNLLWTIWISYCLIHWGEVSLIHFWIFSFTEMQLIKDGPIPEFCDSDTTYVVSITIPV